MRLFTRARIVTRKYTPLASYRSIGPYVARTYTTVHISDKEAVGDARVRGTHDRRDVRACANLLVIIHVLRRQRPSALPNVTRTLRTIISWMRQLRQA